MNKNEKALLEKKLDEILNDVEKPGRYIGDEWGCIKKAPENVELNFVYCFPDIYEIGMSHLGIKILYDIINKRENMWAQRAFMVWGDMEEKMRENNIPLYTMESKMPLGKADVLGFTMQYELSFSTVLAMLDLSGIPLLASERNETFPLVCAGGPCTYNAEPLCDFIDFFMIGEGEDVTLSVCDIILNGKKSGKKKSEILRELSELEGVYVPTLVEVEYNEDGTVKKIGKTIKKVIVSDMDEAEYPVKTPVPYTQAVHDRITMEVMRGCMRGCRFCQAGYIYRPKREKSPDRIYSLICDSYKNTGYDEISLSSLSTSDYNGLKELKEKLTDFKKENMINVALPSLRIDNFKEEALESLNEIRKSTVTFAPEAGTQKMRDIINKNIYEDEIMNTMQFVFENGMSTVKLYFMIGLPFETDEDVLGISELAKKIESLYYSVPKEKRGGRLTLTVSVSSFVPKAHTPFQWVGQNTYEEFLRKQELLRENLKSKNIRLNWHDSKASVLEGIFARGDRRLGKVIYEAYKSGCKLDGWSECFSYEKWMEAFKKCGIDPTFYNERERKIDEILPWETVSCGVTKEFFISEYEKSKLAETSPNCSEKCLNCGANKFICDSSVCKEKKSPKRI